MTNVTLLVDESDPLIVFRESANIVNGDVTFNRNPSIEIVVTDPHSTPTVTSTIGTDPYISLTPITIDGRYTIHVVAVDEAGNRSQADLNILVDKVAPVVELRESGTLLDPAAGAKFNRDAAIDVAVSDATSTATKSITLDGVAYVSGTPITTERVHALLVRAEDEAHNVTDVMLSMLIDKSAPRIEFRDGATLLDVAVLQKFGRDVVLDIRAIDDVSSATFTATLNAAPYTSLTPIAAERLHEVKVDAVDAAGNHATATLRLLIDKTPPAIVISESGTPLDLAVGTSFRRPAIVGVTVTDNLPPVDVVTKLDGSDYTPGTPIAADGHHTVTVTATDSVGNEVTATARLLVDQTGPAIVFREGTRVLDASARQLFNHTPAISIDVTDELSATTPTVTLDGQPFTSGSIVSEGTHVLHVRAVDVLGNETIAELRMLVDATKPVISLTTGGQPLPATGAIFNHDISITANVQDISATEVTATLNGDPFSLALPVVEERQHTLVVTAVDELAWTETATSTFIVDKTAPKLSIFETAGDTRKPLLNGDSFARPVKIDVDADDLTQVTRTATIDGAAYILNTPYAINGEHTLIVNAVDAAGNASAQVTVRFLLDQNRPEVVLKESGEAYAGGKTFDRDVVFTATATAATPATTTAKIDGQDYTLGAAYGVEGHHTIVVDSTNVAGTTTVTATFSIDKTDPTVVLFAGETPFVNGMKFTANFVLRAVAADNLANPPRLAITLDQQLIANDTTITEEGFHDVEATVTDDAGRTAKAGPFHFVLDKTRPEVTVKVDGNELVDNAQFNKAITPEIKATDLTTATIAAKLNGNAYVLDTLIETDDRYTLEVTATDDLGQQTTLEPLHFIVDKTRPIVIVKENGVLFTGGQFARNVTPTLDITDLTDTSVLARLDGNPYTPGQEISSEGKHRLEVTVTDELLWVTEVPAIEFTIDKTAPEVTITESGQPLVSGTIFNRAVRPKIAVTDTTDATVTATLNGQPFTSESLVDAERLHELKVTVTDELAHETVVPPIEFVVDRTAPLLTLTESGVALVSGAKLNHDAVPHLAIADLTHTNTVATLDGNPYALDTPVTAEGPHTLSIKVTDAADWFTELNDVRFFIDKTKPLVTVKVNGVDLVSGAEFKVSIAPEVQISDISETSKEYVLDGQPYVLGTEIASEGTHLFTVTATDALQWITVVGPLSFVIDKTPPRVTVMEQGITLVTGRKFDRAVTPVLEIVDLTKTVTNATIDGQPWTSGTPVETENNHVLTGTVTDNLGQLTTIEPISFFIDRTPPVVRVKANGQPLVSGTAFGDRAQITIEVDDITQTTIDAKLNGAAFTSGATVIDEAQYTLNVTVTDEVGNKTIVPAITFYIDKTDPLVQLIEGTRPDVRPLTDEQWFNRTVMPDANVDDITPTTSEATLLFNGNARAFALGDALTAEGTYRLTVKVTDAVGHVTNVAPVTFHIDLTPPEITFTTPAAESSVVSPQLLVAGDSDDAVTVDVNGIDSIIDATAKTYVTSAALDLLEGANAIAALGIDRAGNNTTIGMNVYLDTRAPQLAITAPAADTCVKTSDVVVRGTISDAGITTIKVSLGDNTPTDATVSGREWSATLPLPAEGKQTIKVVAVDPSGHNAVSTLPITVDRTKPVVVVIENGVPFIAPIVNRPVALFVRANDLDRNAALTVTLNGAPYVSGTTVANDGAYTLRATAVDCAGNASDEKIVPFIIDRTPPAITSVTPANNSTITNKPPIAGTLSEPAGVFVESTNQQATIAGTSFSLAYALQEGTNAFVLVARDAAGNSSRLPYSVTVRTTAPTVEIVESGAPIAANAVYRRAVTPELRSSDPDATFTATLNGNAFTSGTAVTANGSYTLTARARDAFGHDSQPATATFSIDRGGPAVNITAPATLAQIAAAEVIVSGTYTDARSVTVNGIVATLTNGAFSATIPLDLGENMIIALATDASGNTATDQIAVTRPRGAIAILLKSPPHGLITNRPTVPVAGQVVTIAEAASVTVNGQVVQTDPAGNFFVPEHVLVEGANEIKATVISKTGQSNSAIAMVTADFTPPVLKVLANGIELTDGARFATSPEITLLATDAGNEQPAKRLILDGSPAASPANGLANGGHSISAFARDAAGNEARADLTLFVGSATSSSGCGFSAIEPANESAVSGAMVRINGRSGGAVRVLINGAAADVADGSFCGTATLQPGRNEITIHCADENGQPTSDEPLILVLYRYDDPEITIATPAPGAVLTTNSVTVSGTVSAGVTSGDVNGIRFDVPASRTFSVDVPLASGVNVLAVRARTASQRAAVKTVRVRFAPNNPQLIITSPLPGTQTGATSVDVSGTYANLDPSTISVGGSSATIHRLSDTSGTFSVSSVSIGVNATTTITATSGSATATTDVKQIDGPSIVISEPSDNTFASSTSSGTIHVTGTITAAGETPQVQVNGVAATLNGSTFAADVAYAGAGAGITPIVARVTSLAGVSATDSVRVIRFAKPFAVTETFPAAASESVDPGVVVLALFSTQLDGATATNAVRLTDAAGETVPGDLYVDRDTISFAPHAALRFGASYTLTIGTSLRDVAGASLAAAHSIGFTVASTAPAAPPDIDEPPTTGCFDSYTVTGRASKPGARVRLDVDGVTLTATAGTDSKFSFRFAFSGQPGYHSVRVRQLGDDGTLSAERAFCVLINCAPPTVTGATLDRAARTLQIQFSKSMNLATLIASPAGTIAITPDGETTLTGTVALNAAGNVATIALPALAEKDILLLVKQALVKDTSGLALSTGYTQRFPFSSLPPTEQGKGYVSGAVYDATTGRPLAGAQVEIAGDTTLVTSERGRYTRSLSEGAYTIRASATGFTTVWRQIVVPVGAGVVPIDIRLTKRGAVQTANGAPLTLTHGGDTAIAKSTTLALAAPSLVPGARVRLTAIGAQSLAGLLPLGWSPLASAEIVVDDSSDPAPLPGAKLTFAIGTSSTPLSLVRYDRERDEWRVIVAVAVAASNTFDIDTSGNYALVYADSAPQLAKPPAARGGAVLAGVSNPCASSPEICTLTKRSFTLDPPTVLPNGRTVATLTTEGATQTYPSGTAVQAFIDEQLNLADGRVLVDPPFATDLLIYRSLAGDSGVADFHLAPTPQAAAVILRDGVDHIRIVDYPGRIDRGTLVGADGGRVPGDDRISLDIPRGAVAEPLHASAISLTDSDLARLGGVAGFRVAGGFRFSLTRTNPPAPQEELTYAEPELLKSATASLFVSGSASQVIVAEVLPRTQFGVMLRLAAIASPSANQNVFLTRSIPFAQLPLDGITRAGEYLILVPNAPIAYAYGNVRHGGAGTAVENARVTSGIGAPVMSNAFGVADLTRIDGNFVVPVAAKPAAVFSLLPRSPVSGDGAVTLGGSSPDPDTYINFGVLPLTIQPPALVGLTPADGATLDVTAAFIARAQFDVAIDSASAAGGLRIVDVTTGAALTGTISVNGANVSLNLTQALRPGTRYAITVAPTLRGVNGAPFGQTVVHQFSTHALPPGNTTIKPELIRITIPDANGKSTISGSPGALPAGAQAIAVRRGRFFIVSYQTEVTNANGSFSFDAGHSDARDRISIEDAIDLQVLDPVSRAIVAVIELTPFVDADGRGFIASPARTTRFTSADGIALTVEENTFDVPTPIRVVAAARETAAEVTNFDQELTFHAGVRIEFEGIAKKRIDVELPAPANTNPDFTYVLGRLGESARGARVELVDILRIDAGKFTTYFPDGSAGVSPAEQAASSPPSVSTETKRRRDAARSAGGDAGAPSTNAGAGVLVNREAKKWLLGIVRSGIHYALDLKVNQPYWAFLEPLNVGIEMHWSLYQSLFVSDFYMTESRGRIAVPVAPNVPFTVVGIDSASGLRSFEKLYNLTATDPNIPVDMDPPDPDKHGPYPVFVSPGGVDFLDLADEDEPLETVYYKAELSGSVALITNNPETDSERRLKPKTTLQLLNTRTGDVAFTTIAEGSTFSVSINAEKGDRIAVMRGGVDVPAESVISIAFNEPLDLPAADPARTQFLRDNVKLRAARSTKAGEPEAPEVDLTEQVIFDPDSGDRRLNLTLPGSALSSGVRYELELRPDLVDMHNNPLGRGLVKNGDTTSPNGGAESFRIDFVVREPEGLLSEFELQPSELYKGGTVRDFASYGNIVFVSALDGGILAYDGSEPGALDSHGGQQPKPFAYVPGHWKDEQGNTIIRGADQHWAVTTDLHGRVYTTAIMGDFTLVRGYRVEDFIKAKTESMCDVNLPNALCQARGSAIVGWRLGYSSTLTTLSGILVSDRVEAIPRKLQILLQDEQVDLDYDEFRQAFNAVVQTTYANDFRKLRVPFQYNSPDPYLSQRVTIENLTTGMKWSADIRKNGGGAVEGVLARPGDKLRLYRNVRTYGVISQMGYGIGVYDLNAIESNDEKIKPAGYQLLREQIVVTPAALEDSCWPDIADLDPFSTDAIADLALSGDNVVLPDPTDPARALVFAPSPLQGLLGVGVNLNPPPPALGTNNKDCVDRRHGLLLHHGTEWHPRLQPIVDAYGGAPIARFQQVAHYRPVYETDGGSIAQDYILIAGGQVGLLAISPNRPAGTPTLHEDLEEASLAGLVWVPKGVFGVRMIPGTHLAAVVDGKRRLLIVDLTNIDERFDEEGNPIPEDVLFPTPLKALEAAPAEAGEIGVDDPRILWASEPDTVFGTLVPLVDPETGIAFVGDVTTKKMRIVAAINPKVRIVADLGDSNGLSEVTTVIPMGVPLDQYTKQRLERSKTASASAFRVEMTLPGGLAKVLRDAGHDGVEIAVQSEVIPGAIAPQTPESLPKAHLRTKKPNGDSDPRDTRLVLRRDLPVDDQGKEIPELAEANRHQKGFNRFVSPWIFALADPRAAKDYEWGENDAKEKREESGCYACVRPEVMKDLEEPLVYELYTAGRVLSIAPQLDLFKDTAYEYLGEKSRTEVRVDTIMADTVRPTEVLVAAQVPPMATGMLEETIFLHSGELDTGATDLHTGGRAGWDVVIDRTYRSRTLGLTALGQGWDSTLFKRVRPLPNGDVEYHDGAEVWRFANLGDRYLAPEGVFLRLTRTDRGWLMIDQEWRVTTFDEYGRLLSEADEFYKISDPDSGNVVRYAYDAQGRLAKIIDPVGRVTSLSYYDEDSKDEGLLDEVTDWRSTPRKVKYSYDEHARLEKVELPEVENTSSQRPRIEYAYAAATGNYSDKLELSGNLESITEPKEALGGGKPRLVFEYGEGDQSRDRVLKEEWATGETASFTYPSSTTATATDVLGQERTYTMTEMEKDDPLADRVHFKEITESGVEVWGDASFGQLPSTLLPGIPSIANRDRKLKFAYDGGVLTEETIDGVQQRTSSYKKPAGAPGLVVSSTTTGPSTGGGGGGASRVASQAFSLPAVEPITREVVYQNNVENGSTFLQAFIANGKRIEAPEAHRNNPEPSANNNQINETTKFDKNGLALEVSSSGGTDTNSAGAESTSEYWDADGPLHARGLPKSLKQGELVTTYEYPSDTESRVTDSRGVVTVTRLDAWSRPVSVRTEKQGDSLASEEETEYDVSGRIARVTRHQNGKDVITTFEYDVMGRITSETTDGVATVGTTTKRTTYDLANHRVLVEYPGGSITTAEMDRLGREKRTHTTTGHSPLEMWQAYDLADNVVYSSDMFVANARAFDAHRRVIAELDTDGVVATYEYDAWDRPLKARQVAGAETLSDTTLQFTDGGALQEVASKVDDAHTLTSRFAWDGAGRTTAVATAGRASQSRFDLSGRLLDEATGTGDLGSLNEVFARREVTSFQGMLPAVTRMSEKGGAAYQSVEDRNVTGNVVRRDVGKLEWTQKFDELGHRVAASMPNRPEHRWDVDAGGKVESEHLPGGGENKFAYDASGAPNNYTDPSQEPTATEVDLLGRPLKRTYADGTTEVIEWEGSRISAVTDRQGHKQSYIYDAKGRVTEIRDGSNVLDRFTYDDASRMTSWKSADAEITWGDFNLDGTPRRTTQRRFRNGSGVSGSPELLDEFTQEHVFNEHGERTAFSMPAAPNTQLAAGFAKWLRQSFDAMGNIQSIERMDDASGTGATSIMTAAYRSANRPDQRTVMAGTTPIVREYGYDSETSQLNALRVRLRGSIIAGSEVEFDGVQKSSAQLLGIASGERSSHWTYDDRSRLVASVFGVNDASANAGGSGPGNVTEDLSLADFRTQQGRVSPFDDATRSLLESRGVDVAAIDPPSMVFTEGSGHRIASVQRGAETSPVAYDGGSRIDDGKFVYDFDVKGRLLRATAKAPAPPFRRVVYAYSGSDRLVGRRAEYATVVSPQAADWKLEDRAAVLSMDGLPADTTFVWDPISDRLAAVYKAGATANDLHGGLIKQVIHGGAAYDDPLETISVEAVSGAVVHFYPVYDEAGARALQAVVNERGEIVARNLPNDVYGGENLDLVGAAVDRVTVTARKDAQGAVESVAVDVHLTEQIAPATVAGGVRLALVDKHGGVQRTSAAVPAIGADPFTVLWTLDAVAWNALMGGADENLALSVAVTKDLRTELWPVTVPVMPAPQWAVATKPVYTTAALPVEVREGAVSLHAFIDAIPPEGEQSLDLYHVTNLALLGVTGGRTAMNEIVSARLHAHPLSDPFTELEYVRARWYDPDTGTFLTPDPMGFADSSNLYSFAGSDPVNNSDPTGLCFGLDDIPCFDIAKEYYNNLYNPFEWGASAKRSLRFALFELKGAALAIPRSVKGVYQVVRHPVDTVVGVAGLAKAAWDDPGGMIKRAGNAVINADPDEAAEFVGENLFFAALGGAPATVEGAAALSKLRVAARARGMTWAEKQLVRIANKPRYHVPKGQKTTAIDKTRRFFLSQTSKYPGVDYWPGGRFLKKHFPQFKWQQHHAIIQRKWYKPGGLHELFPHNPTATAGLKRLADAGWNLVPIPGSWNGFFGRSSLGTRLFATAYYGTPAAAATAVAYETFDEDEDDE
ncbi:MAG: Ig-like domain-containing protein [Thermoanaerobaculia bacterium]